MQCGFLTIFNSHSYPIGSNSMSKLKLKHWSHRIIFDTLGYFLGEGCLRISHFRDWTGGSTCERCRWSRLEWVNMVERPFDIGFGSVSVEDIADAKTFDALNTASLLRGLSGNAMIATIAGFKPVKSLIAGFNFIAGQWICRDKIHYENCSDTI